MYTDIRVLDRNGSTYRLTSFDHPERKIKALVGKMGPAFDRIEIHLHQAGLWERMLLKSKIEAIRYLNRLDFSNWECWYWVERHFI